MLPKNSYEIVLLALLVFLHQHVLNCVFRCLDSAHRFVTVLYHVHVTKKLPAAPRPRRADSICGCLEWYLLGHARLILETRGHGGVQLLLAEWRAKTTGNCFVIWLGPFTPNIVLHDPSTVKHVLTSTKLFTKSFVYDAIRFVVPEGITNAEGDRWKFLRRLVTPCFHNEVVELLVQTMSDTGKQHLAQWASENKSDTTIKKASSVNFHERISRLTLAIIMRATLGREGDYTDTTTYADFGQMMSYTAETLVSPLRFLLGSWIYIRLPLAEHREYHARIARLETIVTRALRDAMAEDQEEDQEENQEEEADDTRTDQPTNLMRLLLREQRASGSNFTEKTLRDQLGTFLAAGHDTTASLISFTINQCLRNVSIMKKLREEADIVLPNDEEEVVGYGQVARLVYTTACLQEGLRLDSPGPIIAREAKRATTLVGENQEKVPVAEGTSVWLAIYLLHRDPKHWDDPDTYDPTRWLLPAGSSSESNKQQQRPTTSYIPFSYGARNCVGQRFAMLEAATLLSMIVRSFDMKLDETKPPIVRETALVNRPRDGLWVHMVPREKE